jgi:ribosomal-protein-alanine acetyltransferase/tRNA threonylcarbamoyl adenosine modification protein YeaZ
MVADALEQAGVEPLALKWVVADLGPGSFTGVRVGLATARALALAAGAELHGASSLSALALGARLRRALIVPLVPAGRRDVYAGFFRADTRGHVAMIAAPRVGPVSETFEDVARLAELLGRSVPVRFVGPAVTREREVLEAFRPASTEVVFRHDALSAEDLIVAMHSGRGPRAGLPVKGEPLRPSYVRPAQAEHRVRHQSLASERIMMRDMTPADLPHVAEIEKQVFDDAWPQSFFEGEVRQRGVFARIAEWHPGGADAGASATLAGYLMVWIGFGSGHLGNVAVVPELRRHGIAAAMLDDLFRFMRGIGASVLTLEVRASNAPAQALYRAHGFRVAGLRRAYYRDSGEDALIMEWRAHAEAGDPASPNDV